jgi:hypothetical protein
MLSRCWPDPLVCSFLCCCAGLGAQKRKRPKLAAMVAAGVKPERQREKNIRWALHGGWGDGGPASCMYQLCLTHLTVCCLEQMAALKWPSWGQQATCWLWHQPVATWAKMPAASHWCLPPLLACLAAGHYGSWRWGRRSGQVMCGCRWLATGSCTGR